MNKLIALGIFCFISFPIYAQTIPFQIEHDSTSGIILPHEKNRKIEGIIDNYFEGDYRALEKNTRGLLKSLDIASDTDLEENIYNVFVYDHNFKKISKGISFLIGDGIDNPYQTNIYKVPNDKRSIFEVIFYLKKYEVLSTFSFKRGEDNFDANIATYTESIVTPLSGITSNIFDYSTIKELPNKFVQTIKMDGESIFTINLIDIETNVNDSVTISNFSVQEKNFLGLDPKTNKVSEDEIFNIYNKILDEITYKYSSTKVNFPGKLKGMNQSTLTIDRAYLNKNSKDAKPFTYIATYTMAGKKRWSFGLLTGAVVAFKGNNREKAVIEENVVTSKEIARAMTMGIVNYSLGGVYQKKDFGEYTFFERTSVFAGIVITPETGFGAGISFDLFKKVSFNVGGILMITTEENTATNPSSRLKTTTRNGLISGFSIKI